MEVKEIEHQDSFQSLIDVLQKSKNDSQRFAALLITTKAINANIMTENEILRLFKAIGFEFPIRLMSTSDNSDTSDFMKEIGVSILSSFSTNQELLEASEVNHAVPGVLKLLDSELGNTNLRITHDCLQFVLSLTVNSEEGQKSILRGGGFESICKYYCNSREDELKNLAFTAIVHLLTDNQYLWEVNNEMLINLLIGISLDIKCDQSKKKFELIKQMSSLLQTLPEESKSYFYENRNWLDNLNTSIFEILCSKLSEEFRKTVLLLAACLTNLFDLKWTVNQTEENKLTIILIRLVCIEINIILQCTDTTNNRFDLCVGDYIHILPSYFLLFERSCEHVAEFDQEINNGVLSFDQITALETALCDVAKSISEVVDLLREDQNEFHLACMRIIGSWLNIPYYCLSKTGLEIENIILNSFKILVKDHYNEVIKILSPAILNYGEHEKGKFEIENSDVVFILGNLLCNNEKNLPAETITLISQCLITLSIESKSTQVYTSMLENCMQKAIELSTPDVVTKIYISTFVVMIWNKTDDKSLNLSNKFFKSLVAVLNGIHFRDGNQIKCVKRNKSWWPEIEQLWPILMNELNLAVKKTDWLMNFVKSSEFYKKIVLFGNVNQANEINACYNVLHETLTEKEI